MTAARRVQRLLAPSWHLVPVWETDEHPNHTATYVMKVGTKGVLVKVSDWSLGSLSVTVTFVPDGCLSDFGIEDVC